jgi:choline dehydrogenase-like flavoprotein
MDSILHTGTLIIGSGAAGATIARELARRNDKVLILEQGKHHTWSIGKLIAYNSIYNIIRTDSGMSIHRGITTGGSTVICSGNASPPPAFLEEKIPMDLSAEINELFSDIQPQYMPEELLSRHVGIGSILASAEELGYSMNRQLRLVNYQKCTNCGRCHFGCSHDAKWSARNYINDAVRHGATLLNQYTCKNIIIRKGDAIGVNAFTPGGEVTIYAQRIVLSAGAIGTAAILHNSGIKNHGNFFTDPFAIVMGLQKKNSKAEQAISFTHAYDIHADEFIIGNLGALNAYLPHVLHGNIHSILRGYHMENLTGLFVKLTDTNRGYIDKKGRIHKQLSRRERLVMRHAINIAKKILINAGAKPKTIEVASGFAFHPGGTAPLGKTVNTSFQSAIGNLYICDASVLPCSAGVSPMITIMALAKHLGSHLPVDSSIMQCRDRDAVIFSRKSRN